MENGSRTPQDQPEAAPSGIDQALAAPADPLSDPGPGERSGLSSRVAEELLDDGAYGPEDIVDPDTSTTRAVEIDDPARAVGDDPAHPIHGTMSAEFEQR